MVISSQDRMRAKLKSGDTNVRILLSHPMRSAREAKWLANGLPEEFIQDIRCWRNGIEVLTLKCGVATSANPYFSFQLVGGQQGDVIAVRWVDNLGAKGKVETIVS